MVVRKISFCIVCMNRSSHLQNTLLKNIQDNINYKNLEFILLDYNSDEKLDDWINDNFKSYIVNGILKYYRTDLPQSFHRSHSRNVVLKLAAGDIICNLDADNYLGKDFAHFINYHFSYDLNIFLTSGYQDGSYGRICVRKIDFLKVRGYDEKMSGWGYEDDDLYVRLKNLGLKQIKFYNKTFTQFLEHEIEDNFKNDKNVTTVEAIYVSYITYNKTKILFIRKDHTFKYGIIYKLKDDDDIELEGKWHEGNFKYNKDNVILNFRNQKQISMKSENSNTLLSDNNECFKLLTNTLLINSMLRILTSLENKNYYLNKTKKTIRSNAKNWGETILSKTFY